MSGKKSLSYDFTVDTKLVRNSILITLKNQLAGLEAKEPLQYSTKEMARRSYTIQKQLRAYENRERHTKFFVWDEPVISLFKTLKCQDALKAVQNDDKKQGKSIEEINERFVNSSGSSHTKQHGEERQEPWISKLY